MSQNPETAEISTLDEVEKIAVEIANEECFSLANLAINGSDLIKEGFCAGKGIGEILNILLNEVIEEKIPNEKNSLIKRALQIKNDCQ